MNLEIRESVKQRKITHLCHFTPSRNLAHIASDPQGILATAHLEKDERAVFNRTDLERWDGHKDHVCCSVQVPNIWYFRKVRAKSRIFPHWVVLLIAPHYLWREDVKFCPRNAAARGGRAIDSGHAAFEAMFAPRVDGAHSKEFSRSANHPACLPTDGQAEILIPDRVSHKDILGIVVQDIDQAECEIVRFQMLKESVPRILVNQNFFASDRLAEIHKTGNLSTGQEYYLGDEHA